MFGLLIASVLCLGYAWLHRDPPLALQPNPAAIESLLWRTTTVVAISAVVILGSYLLGGLNRLRGDWRSKFFAYVSAALVILAVTGLLMLGRGQTKEAFDAANTAQQSLIAFDVTTVAKWAWWCACLAVIALALVAAVGHAMRPGPRPLWDSPILSGAVAVVVVVIVAVSLLATRSPAMANLTASPIDPPPLNTVAGDVAYRITEAGSPPLPAGAGFVRVIPSPTTSHGYSNATTIEGYDGATGQRRWAYGPADELSVLGATGIGPDSVVLGQVANILIGLDATTGTPLWFKTGDTTWDPERTTSQLSPNVIVAARPTPAPPGAPATSGGTVWEALSPRTGEVLWTKEFGYQCAPAAHVAHDFIAVRSCESAPGVVADVYDARTGAATKPVQLSALRVNPADIGPNRGGITIDDVTGDAILVTVSIYGPEGIDRRFIVELADGAARQLPERRAATFIDTESVLLSEFRGRNEPTALSILDLPTNTTIPIGYSSGQIDGEAGYLTVVRVGTQWWTHVPADQSATTYNFTAPLRSIDPSGASRQYPSPCPEVSQPPRVTVAAGVLIVNCGRAEFPAIR
ncbi:hypothetical protein AFM11_10320 [Mycolicibacterium wolinskyi]|uniref:Uncharacterized protein n=2 Tax=Mycolicibacterium wolinskyi TaxID=59750 RepID=A0A132PPU1_9MYCO|nr:hypothetical protein AFM11_10320 [Mycolicibacterium wolinskyi]